jgi:hypothetical protein
MMMMMMTMVVVVMMITLNNIVTWMARALLSNDSVNKPQK